jgi:hypothetical protein
MQALDVIHKPYTWHARAHDVLLYTPAAKVIGAGVGGVGNTLLVGAGLSQMAQPWLPGIRPVTQGLANAGTVAKKLGDTTALWKLIPALGIGWTEVALASPFGLTFFGHAIPWFVHGNPNTLTKVLFETEVLGGLAGFPKIMQGQGGKKPTIGTQNVPEILPPASVAIPVLKDGAQAGGWQLGQRIQDAWHWLSKHAGNLLAAARKVILRR